MVIKNAAIVETRRGALVMTIPKAFIEQKKLHEGSKVNLMLEGDHITITAPTKKKRYSIEALMAEMTDGLPKVDGCDEMQATGLEVN